MFLPRMKWLEIVFFLLTPTGAFYVIGCFLRSDNYVRFEHLGQHLYWGLSRIPGGCPHERLCMEFPRPQFTKLTDEELFFFICYDVTVL